jgi:hypothetical protein
MKLSLLDRILILIFLLIGIFSYWTWKKNPYSKEVLKIEILGPNEVTVGKEVEFIVKYKNNGNFRLEEPELIFEPPENSLKDDQIAKREVLREEKLGNAIYPGEENTLSFKLRIFGKEGEMKIAKATMSFRPKNLKARYSVSTSFSTQIKSVPVTFEFDLPSKIENGKELNFKLDYFSNLDSPLTNLRIQVEYPKSFEFFSSTPQSIEKTEWEIPVLNKAEGGRIEIQGKILGEIGKVETFRARLGILNENQFIVLKEIEKGVEIVKPSIFLRQEINGNPEYVAAPGEWLHYTIYFKNIGDEEMKNLFLISKLEGDAFDFQTIKSDLGECKPGDDSVIFDWRRVPKLQYLAPTDEGKVDFWIKLKDDLGNVRNPFLKNKIFILQMREEFITKISSRIEVSQKGFYYDEVFGNSGPIPPRVGEATTYTIFWQVKNYYSDVKDVKVRAKLPEYVSLTGKIFPEEMASKFSFDPNSREIVWSLGELKGGEGISTPPKTIAFQISFSPTESQRGQTPEIIGEVKISGEDSWTGKTLEATSTSITTALPDDPQMKPEMGVVK